MADGGLSASPDWTAPWYAPYRAAGERVEAQWRAGAALCEALNHAAAMAMDEPPADAAQRPEACDLPIRFAPQSELPEGTAYESHIFATRRCPTRENLHDFFNGLCWIALPRAKRRMNEIQAGEIARAGIGAVRGPVRDAVTLFDENGAVLHAPPALWEALRQREWRRLFVDLRPSWDEARLLIVGHALLEKLAAPRKDLTAHVWAFPAPGGGAGTVDAWLAEELAPERLRAKPFLPLPVLGIPGWCALNEDFSFYDDAQVFRPVSPHGSKNPGPPAPP